jgi:hypothetical protein
MTMTIKEPYEIYAHDGRGKIIGPLTLEELFEGFIDQTLDLPLVRNSDEFQPSSETPLPLFDRVVEEQEDTRISREAAGGA